MEWGVLVVVVLGLVLAFVVLQATMAARHWRRVIAAGDLDALRQALDEAFDGWRSTKPARGQPPADWQGLQSATLVAARSDRCRVSLLAGPDIRVTGNERHSAGSTIDVGRRVAVSMAERLLYEVPHVRFDEVQVDVYAQAAGDDGASLQHCLVSTRVTRSAATTSDWDTADAEQILAGWQTREATPEQPLDPDDGALIEPETPASAPAMKDHAR